MSQRDCAPRDAIDEIDISTPCTVSWDQMRPRGGDGRVRYCGQCRQNVYDVEAMSRAEAHRQITAREGRVCVRILRRPDGTVVTADCWARLRAARRHGVLPFLGMMMLVGLMELVAIGAGLGRLRRLMAGGPPNTLRALQIRRRDVLPSDIGTPPLMGLMGELPAPEPKVHELGGLVPRQHLMGRLRRK